MSERDARRKPWRPLLLATCLYAACALALLWPAMTDGNMLSAGSRWITTGPFPRELREQVPPGIDILSDSSNAYVPYMLYAAHNWAQSHALPLWKDTACCGAPFFGNGESALLFPTNLIALLIGTPTWIHAAMAFVKLVAAALGAWALARHLGMSFTAALLAGAVWGFGGMQSAFLLYTPTNVSLLLPWMLLACERFAREPSARCGVAIAALAGLQHFGGHPETTLHCQMIAFALGALRTLEVRGGLRAAVLPVAALAGAFVMGALLAAVQLLPLVEYILQSDALQLRVFRQNKPLFPQPLAAAAFGLALVGALASVRVLARRRGRLLLPALSLLVCTVAGLIAGVQAGMSGSFILPLASDWFGDARTYLGPENYLECNHAFAGAALPLAAAGLLWGRPRRAVFVAGLLLATGLLAGYHAPLIGGLLRMVPLLRIAENARLQFVALLAAALLAGWGLDALGSVGSVSFARMRLLAVTLLPATGAVLALGLATTYHVLPDTNVTPVLDGTQLMRAGLLSRSEIGAVPGVSPAFLEPGPADGGSRPMKEYFGWFLPKEQPTRAQVLWNRDAKSVVADMFPVPDDVARSFKLQQSDEHAQAWLIHARIPIDETVPGATQIRMRISLPSGAVGLSSPLTAHDDPGATPLPFPVQPLQGFARAQLLLFTGVALVTAAGLRLRGRRRALVRVALLALVAGSLAPFAAGLLPELPPEFFYPTSPALELLRHQRPDARMLNLKPQTIPPEIPAAYGVLDVRGYDALYPARVARMLREATDYPDGRLTSLELLPSRADVDLPLLGVMSVRMLTDAEAADGSLSRLRYPGEEDLPPYDPFPVFVNPCFLPRARLVSGAVIEADDTAAIALLRQPDFPRGTTVVLEQGTARPAADAADGAEPAARITRDSPNVLSVSIAPRGAAWLVVSDTFYPGWKAFVDGVERPIVRANVAFRAVAVGPGDGVVSFRYQPPAFIAGAVISLLAGAALLAALVRAR